MSLDQDQRGSYAANSLPHGFASEAIPASLVEEATYLEAARRQDLCQSGLQLVGQDDSSTEKKTWHEPVLGNHYDKAYSE